MYKRQVYLARTGSTKAGIKYEITDRFGYDLERTVDAIRPKYSFDVSCQGSVPESKICFLESVSYEDTVRNAVSLGGDSDTMACVAGGIAEAFYGSVADKIRSQLSDTLPTDLINLIDRFVAWQQDDKLYISENTQPSTRY